MINVFAKLYPVNVNEHTEKKGRFTYISWSHAWTEVCKHFPNSASYHFHDDLVYPDGTREIRCTVTIEGMSHMMWLPVMDNNNRAIKNPDARAISDTRMRCFVKAIAMHGLGLYIYRGEGIPEDAGGPQEVNEPEVNPVRPQDQSDDPQMTLKVQDIAGNWLDFYKEIGDPQKFADAEHKFKKFMDNRGEKYLSAHLTQELWAAHDEAKQELMA